MYVFPKYNFKAKNIFPSVFYLYIFTYSLLRFPNKKPRKILFQTAFLTLLPEVAWTFTFPKFYGGDAACKALKYVQVIGPYLSSYTLVMTAVDRYQVRDNILYFRVFF